MNPKIKNTIIGISVLAGLFGLYEIINYAATVYLKVKDTTQVGSNEPPLITQKQGDGYCARIITECSWFSSDSSIFSDLAALSDANLQIVSNSFANDFTDQNGGMTLAAYVQKNKIFVPANAETLITRLNSLT